VRPVTEVDSDYGPNDAMKHSVAPQSSSIDTKQRTSTDKVVDHLADIKDGSEEE
jgi:hypothetical protein